MSSTINVRDIDPGDKFWLKRKARQVGVFMEEFVRHLIHEKRTRTECRPNPFEAFARDLGEDHGVELPAPARRGYRLVSFSREDGE